MGHCCVSALQGSASGMIVFPIGASGQRLIFSASILERFDRYRQRRWWQREAGGQLFARLDLPEIHIEDATGPRRSDWRSRYGYQPNRSAEQREIEVRHAQNRHFIGDWHTHPEFHPCPSLRDVESMQELVSRSNHALNGFVLAIVGAAPFPDGLSVFLFDEARTVQLRPS